MAQVHWAVSARTDLRRYAAYIAVDSPRQAALFVIRMRDAARRLGSFPQSGRMVPEFDDDPRVREIIVDGYRIIYVVNGDIVDVFAFKHGSQLLRIDLL